MERGANAKLPSVVYRVVGELEFDDWTTSGVLRPGKEGYEYGKCVWEELDVARKWREAPGTATFYSPPVRILRLKIPQGGLIGVFLGNRLDQLGRAWFVNSQDLCKICVELVE